MKEESNTHLASIRRGIWAILGVLLLIFGYAHTPIGRTDPGVAVAFIGLFTGIIMIFCMIASLVFRFLMKLKSIAD